MKLTTRIRARARNWLNFSIPVTVNGRSWKVPVHGGIEAHKVTETWKTRLIDEYSPEHGLFIDAGANLGQTLVDVFSTRERLVYIGFEPNPICVSYLRQLIIMNSLPDICIVPVALSNRQDLLELSSPPAHPADPGSNIMGQRTDTMTLRQLVPVPPFDLVRSKLPAGPLGFVKIDVEGAELETVLGMRESLAKDRPPVLCEVLPGAGGHSAEESDTRRRQLMSTLQELDYRVLHVRHTLKDIDGLDLVEEFRGGDHSRKESWDYLCLPR